MYLDHSESLGPSEIEATRSTCERILSFLSPNAQSNPVFWNQQGLLQLQSQAMTAAVASFSQVLNLFKSATAAYVNLGNFSQLLPETKGIALQLSRDAPSAERVYLDGIAAIPDAYQLLNNLGCLYRQKGQHAKALTALQQCLEIKADYAPAFNNLGLL